jgi:hypothetical protein
VVGSCDRQVAIQDKAGTGKGTNSKLSRAFWHLATQPGSYRRFTQPFHLALQKNRSHNVSL